MLSKRSQDVFRFIVSSTRENGFPPTLREMCERFGIVSTNGIRYFLRILERDGYLRRSPRSSRALEVPDAALRRFIQLYGSHGLGAEAQEWEGIPVLGQVAAGTPLLAEENLEGRLKLDETFRSRERTFALRVRGDSMVDAGILEDDLVVVRQTDQADSGNIVVALVGDEATVKVFRKYSNRVELWPKNKRHRPIVIKNPEEFRVLGVVMGLVRPAATKPLRAKPKNAVRN